MDNKKLYIGVMPTNPVFYLTRGDSKSKNYFHFNINSRAVMENQRRMIREERPIYTRNLRGSLKSTQRRINQQIRNTRKVVIDVYKDKNLAVKTWEWHRSANQGIQYNGEHFYIEYNYRNDYRHQVMAIVENFTNQLDDEDIFNYVVIEGEFLK